MSAKYPELTAFEETMLLEVARAQGNALAAMVLIGGHLGRTKAETQDLMLQQWDACITGVFDTYEKAVEERK